MKTHSITTYSPAELKEQFPDAYDRALQGWRDSQDEIAWQEETFESLKACIEAAGLTLRDWNLGLCNRSNGIEIDFEEATGELSGKRAFAWLENNLFGPLRIPFRGKERWKLSAYNRSYTDKRLMPYIAGKVKPCPLTGYCADDSYLSALTKAVRNGYTLKEAFEGLADTYVELLEAEYEYQTSEECFLDRDDLEFTEDGEGF